MDTAELIVVLGVGDDPTTGEVRLARRSLAKRVHPDLAGEALTRAMAEINAGCDRLIRAIRSGQRRRPAPVAAPPTAAAGREPERAVFRPEYAAVTVALMLLVFALTALVVGASAAGLAVAMLLAALAGGTFVAVLLKLLDRP